MALKAVNVSDVPNLDQVREIPSVASSRLPKQANLLTPALKQGSFAVIGHRGNGMNFPSSWSANAIKENSILSFNEAGRFPISFVEFDVQVTRDDRPIIFHDDFILTEEAGTISENRVTDLLFEEFLSYGPQKESGKAGKPLLRRDKDGRVLDWIVEADDPLCTLEEAFKRVDSHLGFNIELKFEDELVYQDEELTRILGVILRSVSDHAESRPIIFSTFQPDAARLVRELQTLYHVFFLTDGGTYTYCDPRRNSLEEAIKLCLESGLQGIVSEVRAVLRNPSAIASIKECDLGLLTYGELNNVSEAVYMQHLMGIDGVIVDRVQEIAEAVSDFGELGEGGDGTLGRSIRPRFSQRELSFLLKLIPNLIQH